MTDDEHIHATHHLVINPDATYDKIPLSPYTEIRDAVGGSFDFVCGDDKIGGYIHDEGLLIGLELNVAASILLDRCLFGPVVMCMAEPDKEGDTVPLTMHYVKVCIAATLHWATVLEHAKQIGQDLTVKSNADTVPPPRLVPLTDEMMQRIFGGEI